MSLRKYIFLPCLSIEDTRSVVLILLQFHFLRPFKCLEIREIVVSRYLLGV
jgi:hypothetical protein